MISVSDHTARVFDTDLIKVTQLVAQMGGVAQKQVNDAIKDPTIQKRLADLGAEPAQPNTPASFAKFIADDHAKWSKVIKSAGIKPI